MSKYQMSIPIYVIYLEEYPDRKESLINDAATFGIDINLWRGLYGKKTSISGFYENTNDKISPQHISLTLSWLFLLQHLSHLDDEWFVVCEDDVIFFDGFYDKINEIKDEAEESGLNFVYLGWLDFYPRKIENFTNNISKMVDDYPFGTHCMLIHRSALDTLIDTIRGISDHIDRAIGKKSLPHLSWGVCDPSLVRQKSGNGEWGSITNPVYIGKIVVNVVCSIDFDEAYINHFIDYYTNQGVDEIWMTLHSKKPIDPEYYISKYQKDKVKLFFMFGNWSAEIAMKHKRKLMNIFKLNDNDWVVYADIDEHVKCGNGNTIRQKIYQMKKLEKNCCSGEFVDRVSMDGSLSKINSDKTLDEQFPIKKQIANDITGCYIYKMPIVKANLWVNAGHHEIIDIHKKQTRMDDEVLQIHHYKSLFFHLYMKIF
jgi:GR25 family glycosyltransferase involved in LPS biosynthesis